MGGSEHGSGEEEQCGHAEALHTGESELFELVGYSLLYVYNFVLFCMMSMLTFSFYSVPQWGLLKF